MFIKAHNISHLTDARFFAAQPLVEWITFGIPNVSAIATSKEIANWIAGVKKSAHTYRLEISNVYQAYSELSLDAVDMTSADYRKYKDELEIPVFLRMHYTSDLSYRYYVGQEEKIKFIVLEIDDFNAVDTSKLRDLCATYPTILAGKIEEENIEDIMEHIQPAGIELEGSEENQVGIKNFDHVQNIIDLIENFQVQ